MIDTTNYKQRLETDLLRITNELGSIATHDQVTDNWEAVPTGGGQNEADINVEADAVEEWNERRGTVAALEIEYQDIKRALAKLADGSYGYCEICQAQIAQTRLDYKPTARTCTEHLNDESTLTL